MKILFFGDSITDHKRNREDITSLGEGFVKIAAEKLCSEHENITVINKGRAGNEVVDMLNRVENDVVALKPDIVVLMAGINNAVHQYKVGKILDLVQFEKDLKSLLDILKSDGRKLVFLEPYLFPAPEKEIMRELFEKELEIINHVVPPVADVFVPDYDEFLEIAKKIPYTEFSEDGIHPTEKGAALIAERAVAAVETLI